MKKVASLLILSLFALLSFAEDPESVRPTYGIKTERVVSVALIDDRRYFDVTVEMNVAEITSFSEGVKVVVRDEKGKKVYKKRFSQSLFYAYSDGTIQIGKGNALTNMILYKSKDDGQWYMILKEKGIY